MKQTLLFPRRLNSADAGFFFLGERPDCNVAMVMIGVLEREVSFDEMLEELTAAGDAVPRFKDFLSPAPLSLAPPIWMPKQGFEVRQQIHQTRLDDATWDAATAAIDSFQTTPLPANAPPWEMLLINGLPGERALLAMKVHHALSDGMALSLLFAKAFAGDFLANAGVEVVADCEDPPSGSAWGVALADRAEATGAWLRRVARDLPELCRSGARRRRELDAVRRHLGPAQSRQGGYGRTRLLSGFQIEAEAWNREADKRGGSPNDLYLALVARAMRRHFVDWNLDEMPLQIVMPVDLRDESTTTQDGGNVTGVGVVELAGRGADLENLAEVRRRSRAAQEAVGDAAPSLLDEMVQLLPGRARAAVQFKEFAARDLVATNVPMPIPGELCGVPFQMMFMVAPPIGAAVGFSLTSYGDHLYLAANADAAVAGGPLEESVAATLEEVLGEPARSLRGGTMDIEPLRAQR